MDELEARPAAGVVRPQERVAAGYAPAHGSSNLCGDPNLFRFDNSRVSAPATTVLGKL